MQLDITEIEKQVINDPVSYNNDIIDSFEFRKKDFYKYYELLLETKETKNNQQFEEKLKLEFENEKLITETIANILKKIKTDKIKKEKYSENTYVVRTRLTVMDAFSGVERYFNGTLENNVLRDPVSYEKGIFEKITVLSKKYMDTVFN